QAAHPAFKDEVASIKKALDQVGQVTMKFAEWGMGGDILRPQLHAVNYLYNLGDTFVAYLLVDQAVVALAKLEEIWKSQGADNEEKKSKICTENDEARFLEGKVKSARFFVSSILPQVTARAKTILSEDLSALKVRF
ncbi:MAG: acyl-CoA dehydrogenase C-terminal domain-containing protein, partial [Deltaproteobacteria bacterium]|nr:acyl-CoA dehydrogenase C-terminal domain-containing protein [Deltaproteobacteria bacterium]